MESVLWRWRTRPLLEEALELRVVALVDVRHISTEAEPAASDRTGKRAGGD